MDRPGERGRGAEGRAGGLRGKSREFLEGPLPPEFPLKASHASISPLWLLRGEAAGGGDQEAEVRKPTAQSGKGPLSLAPEDSP